MDNDTSRHREGQVRLLLDQETGDVYRVVKEQIEMDGSETLTVTSSLEPNLVQVEPKMGRYGSSKRYVLLFNEGIEMMSDMLDYKGKVFFAMCRIMGYGNKVHATNAGLADLAKIRRQHVSRAINDLIEMGAIEACKSSPDMPDVPAYKVDGRFLFRGAESARNKAVGKESFAKARLSIVKERQCA